MDEKIIELIFGKRGGGKTHLARTRLPSSRYLIYDTLGHDYSEGVIVESIDQLTALWKNTYRGNFRIIYRPLDPLAEFDQVCQLVWACGNMAMLVEEIDCFCPTDQRSLPDGLRMIIQRGRHRNITLVGVTQRPKGISRLLTSQAKKMCIFNTTEPADIDYFKEVIGERIVELFAKLQQYEYVEWVDGRDELRITKA